MATTAKRKRVPETKPLFDSYQRGSTTHLETGTPPRGEELGLETAELIAWKDWRDEWVLLYPTYTNKNTRTTSITENVNNHMKDFSEFAEPLLNRMSGSSVITVEDRNALNIKLRDKTPTAKGMIEDTPIVGLKGVGGGRMKAKVRTDNDASRASMHPLSNLIEMRYYIANEDPTQPGPAPTPGPGDATDDGPTPEDAPHFHISSKSIFEIELGTNKRGKVIIAFFRWVNSSNPANNGPWTLPIIGLIS